MLLPIELDRALVFFDLETKGENDELEARHLRQVCNFRWPDLCSFRWPLTPTPCLTRTVWQGDSATPLNPQRPAPRDAAPEPVPGALVAGRPSPRLHSQRDADAPCRWVGGHGVGRRRRRIPSCRVEAGAVRQPVDFRRSADLSGVEGAEPIVSPCRGPAKRGPKG